MNWTKFSDSRPTLAGRYIFYNSNDRIVSASCEIVVRVLDFGINNAIVNGYTHWFRLPDLPNAQPIRAGMIFGSEDCTIYLRLLQLDHKIHKLFTCNLDGNNTDYNRYSDEEFIFEQHNCQDIIKHLEELRPGHGAFRVVS